MESSPVEFADALWRGEEHHPFGTTGIAQIDPKTLFVASFGNSIALATDDGFVLVDTSSEVTAPLVDEALREWSDSEVHTIVYTHGHIDHVMGAGLLALPETQ